MVQTRTLKFSAEKEDSRFGFFCSYTDWDFKVESDLGFWCAFDRRVIDVNYVVLKLELWTFGKRKNQEKCSNS
jgi:hypothetical protein